MAFPEPGDSPTSGRRGLASLAPSWALDYRRSWLRTDLGAGLVIWSVVTPQVVAYAQIAGLPPQAGLMAAPGAMLAYALLGTSRSLVVSATTATSAVSLAAVGPMAHGDVSRFAALSAALAIATALVLAVAGWLRLGGVADLVSTPVMTGTLFGLALTISMTQLPSLLGVHPGDGNFFPRLNDLVSNIGDAHAATVAVGLGTIALLLALRRLVPGVPGTFVALAGAVAISAALGLSDHGVDVVGKIPTALPDPSVPDVSLHDLAELLPSAFGILIVSAEAIAVARTLATKHGYAVDVNRDLVAMGGSNLLSGLSGGFVQSGGASQTAAADAAGGKTQLASASAAVLVLLTGAFLAPLFKDLPEATLAGIVIVAIAGFVRVDELRRFARVRRSAIVFALTALAGVLVLGVLQGLLVAAGLSLITVIKRLSRPQVSVLARDPASGAWGEADAHPGWETPPGTLVVRTAGPIFYANAVAVKERVLALFEGVDPAPTVVIDLSGSRDLDVGTLDALSELAAVVTEAGSSLRLAGGSTRARDLLRETGLSERVGLQRTLDEAVSGAESSVPGEGGSPAAGRS